MVGSLYASCDNESLIEACRDSLADQTAVIGLTLLDGLLVVRLLADSTSTARALFVKIWEMLRPGILGREAVLPRIWQT